MLAIGGHTLADRDGLLPVFLVGVRVLLDGLQMGVHLELLADVLPVLVKVLDLLLVLLRLVAQQLHFALEVRLLELLFEI